MHRYARAHFADQTLLTAAETHTGQERTSMADLLADLAEIDVRRLYLPLAYRSLHEYCTAKLRLSEDEASKRIHAARTARRFPSIFGALAAGRLHVTGVCLLAAHLTEDNAAGLIEAAMGRSKLQIEQLLAERFPKSDLLPWVTAMPAPSVAPSTDSHAPEHVHSPAAMRDRPLPRPGREAEAGVSAPTVAASACHAQRPPRPGRGAAGGVRAGRRPVRVRERERASLLGPAGASARSHRAGGAGRRDHDLEPPAAVSRTQPARGRADLRPRVHAPQETGGRRLRAATVSAPPREQA